MESLNDGNLNNLVQLRAKVSCFGAVQRLALSADGPWPNLYAP